MSFESLTETQSLHRKRVCVELFLNIFKLMFLLDFEDSVVSIFGEHNIFVVFHNNGLESSCHHFKTPEIPVEFKKISLVKGGCYHIRNKEEFSKISQEYMSVNNFEKCFPPEHLIENKDVKCIIKHFFSSKSSSKNKALVGYSYIDHLEICGYTARDLASFSCSEAHHNAILYFDVQQSMVVYIRVCQENVSTGEIKQEMKMCEEFIKVFLLLYEKAVTIGAMSICAFVALPGISLKDAEDKILFTNHHQNFSLFLLKEDFENYNNFKKTVNKSYYLAKDQQKHSGTKSNNNEMFNKILAECMTSMTFTIAFLPRLSRDENAQVLSLFLNVEQYEAIRHPSKKRIIRGPFGSGKSLIMEKIIEELISSIGNGTIYYIMFEPYSLLEARMDEVFTELLKRTDTPVKLCSSNIHKLLEEANHSSANNKIETVMKYCLEQSTDDVVHFLFDEVDYAYFTEENASGLKDFLKKNDGITLILALQCTEKVQTVHKEKNKYDVPSFCQEDNNKTGMTLLKPLTKSMRMVSNVYELKKIAEDVIKPHSTNLALKEDTIPSFPIRILQRILKPLTRIQKPSTRIQKPSTSIQKPSTSIQETSTSIQKTATRKPADVKNSSINSTSISETVKHLPVSMPTPSNSDVSPKLSDKIKIPGIKESSGTKDINTAADSNEHKAETIKKVPNQIPLDQLPMHNRDIFTDSIGRSSQFFETKYNFHESENGVSIKGSKKPSIIYLDDSLDMESSKAALILSMIFESECFVDKSSKKTTIICNDWLEALLTLFGLKLSSFENDEFCKYIPLLLNKGIPSKEEKKSIWERCNSESHSILVTDFQGFRGCETEVCVTFIDPDESYLRHIVVEVLARAVTNLVVIILPSNSNGRKSKIHGNFRQVLNSWVQKDVVDVYKIDISGNEFSLKEGSKKREVLSRGKFEIKNDVEFENFKLTWEKKGNFHPEPKR